MTRFSALIAWALAVFLSGPALAQDGPPPADAGDGAFAASAERPRATRTRSIVQPYLEIDQVVSADLNGGDVLTYTALAAGVDGRVATRRVEAQISYRYEHRIDWNDRLGDTDIHTGVAQVRAQIVPDTLQLEAGGLAARVAGDGRTGFVSDREAAAQVYGAYAGPSLSTHAGPVAVQAGYRLGYVHVDDDSLAAGGNSFGDAVAHSANASVGMGPGQLPVGWTVAGGYTHEESGALDNRFEGAYVRGDVVVPLSPTFAATAGIGYEEIRSSVSDVVRDANGIPVVTPEGEVVADRGAPRILAYDQSGIIWDVGFLWRPTPRTELQARGGRRYGGTTIVGSLEHRFRNGYGLSANVYDSVDTFGRIIVSNLSGLPSDFTIGSNPLTGGFGGTGGCVFGSDPGSGVCFDQALGALSNATFRNRGANILFSGGRGPWDFRAGAGYAHRRYFRPVSGNIDSLDPRTDQNLTVQAGVGRALGRSANVNLDAFASWYDSDFIGVGDAFTTGATASYYRNFLLDRLRFQAALGLYTTETGPIDSTIASGLVGLRYTF